MNRTITNTNVNLLSTAPAETYHKYWLSEDTWKVKWKYGSRGETKSYSEYDVSFSKTRLNTESKVILRDFLMRFAWKINDKGIHFKIVSNETNNLISYIESKKNTDFSTWYENDALWQDFAKFLIHKGMAFSTIELSLSRLSTIGKKIVGEHPFKGGVQVRSQRIKWVEQYVTDNAQELGIDDVVLWLKGGSYETVTPTTSLLMLGHAIEIIRSEKSKLLQAFCLACRKLNRRIFSNADVYDKTLLEILKNGEKPSTEGKKYRSQISIDKATTWHEEYKALANAPELTFSQFCTIANQYVDEIYTHKNLSIELDLLYSAAQQILLTTCGYRVHEFQNLKADGLSNENGIFHLTTGIDKTHKGLPVKRAEGDIIVETVDIFLNCSFIDKTKEYDIGSDDKVVYPLLAETFKGQGWFNENQAEKVLKKYLNPTEESRSNALSLAYNVIDTRLKTIFNHMIDSFNNEDLKQELLAQNEPLTCHGFRHAWADFLLRRFSGDLLAVLRRKFGHSVSNVMKFTESYIRNKIPAHYKKNLERAYTEELVYQMHSNPDNFSGNVVTYIHKEIENFSYATEEELKELIHEWAGNELMRLVPHSFGFCILFDERIQRAACIDHKDKVLEKERGGTEVCIGKGCGNFGVQHDINDGVLQGIKVVHQNIVDKAQQPTLWGSILANHQTGKVKLSESMVTTIERLLGREKASV